MKVELGGQRLGSGGKENLELRNYERSTHDLSRGIKTTMSAGTLVPIYTTIALPGDSMDIEIDCDVKTHPTVGPLFGSYKVQIDAFVAPIRLYQGLLHMNMMGIGTQMHEVKLPQMKISAKIPEPNNIFVNRFNL